MKEKIKKWISYNIVLATSYLVMAVYTLCVGDWLISAFCFGFSLCCLVIYLKDEKCKKLQARNTELLDIADEVNRNAKKASETAQWANDEFLLEAQRHRLTAIQGMKYKNKVDFMQRKKSLSEYLKYSDAINSLYEQEVKRLHEMLDEIKNKNNEGTERKDTETKTTGAE